MKQTIGLSDNYGIRLKDEIINNGINNGLKGEVQVILKNKNTGEIESQQRHNLIVYGAREWLLRKCFSTNTCLDNYDKKFLEDSEILWFGVGNGGGEPGNPLQCGCTYGSDKDLYNPVRLRYEFDTQNESTNPYYASRIMANGDIVNGYYKKITYVGIKEDQANPYKKNGIICYPNLIAEVRLEISSDDCCGQNWLNNDTEIEYSDINEAALFIADKNLSDPGHSGKLSYITQDFMSYDPNYNRIYKIEDVEGLPEYIVDTQGKYNWKDDKTFPDVAIQYFDVYNFDKTVKYNTEPILFGYWTDSVDEFDKNKCTGYIQYKRNSDTNESYLICKFDNKRYGQQSDNPEKIYNLYKKTNLCVVNPNKRLQAINAKVAYNSNNNLVTDPSLVDTVVSVPVDYKEYAKFKDDEIIPVEGEVIISILENDISRLKFVSHGTILIDVKKTDRFDENSSTSEKIIDCYCKYRNGYTTDFTLASPIENLFIENRETYKYIFPINYIFDNNGNLKYDKDFNKLSIIRFIQSVDVYFDININQVIIDEKSTEVKFYCDDEYIDKINEDMKFYCTNVPEDCEGYPTEENPATITQIFDGRLHRSDDSEEQKISLPSYFIIDNMNIKQSRAFNPPLLCKVYKKRIDSPYIMFNRCTFSTIRLSKSRELLLIWRVYF